MRGFPLLPRFHGTVHFFADKMHNRQSDAVLSEATLRYSVKHYHSFDATASVPLGIQLNPISAHDVTLFQTQPSDRSTSIPS